ncbi:MAG: hypothetical protein M3083_09825 [Actinomycetota bacterium]|nr:hypothetical protein [Actinomycetota bacterium]
MASTTCPACGLPAPEGARYCSHCAAPLAAPATPGEPRGSAPQHLRRQTRGWVKALIVVLGVAVLAAVAVAIILAVGVGRASNNFSGAATPKPGRPSGYHGPAYPGMLVQDHVGAGADAAIDVLGESLTTGNLKRTPTFFGPTLCSPVTITNHSLATKDIGPAEWKLQQPNGIVESFALTGTLQSGQIAPGGTANGTVCFADTGQSGTFVLLWQPLLRVDRGVWILHL